MSRWGRCPVSPDPGAVSPSVSGGTTLAAAAGWTGVAVRRPRPWPPRACRRRSSDAPWTPPAGVTNVVDGTGAGETRGVGVRTCWCAGGCLGGAGRRCCGHDRSRAGGGVAAARRAERGGSRDSGWRGGTRGRDRAADRRAVGRSARPWHRRPPSGGLPAAERPLVVPRRLRGVRSGPGDRRRGRNDRGTGYTDSATAEQWATLAVPVADAPGR